MFTKCPECDIAFRVTAKVLQQAKGNVRCGGCQHAFNALEYLFEESPQVTVSNDVQAPHDELAETSRRLLQTLDELAGPDDVRIEDTGVEWRVLAEDEETDAPDELRYDDNTPLPDDYDDEEVSLAPPPQRRESDLVPDVQFSEMQGDLELTEPEEWTDLLDEVSDEDIEAIPELEVAATGNTDDPSDSGTDEEINSQSPEDHETIGDSGVTDEDELTFLSPDTDEADTPAEEEDADLDLEASAEEEYADEDREASASGSFDIADLETQFNTQAEALGITGSHEIAIDAAVDADNDATEHAELSEEEHTPTAVSAESADANAVDDVMDEIPDDADTGVNLSLADATGTNEAARETADLQADEKDDHSAAGLDDTEADLEGMTDESEDIQGLADVAAIDADELAAELQLGNAEPASGEAASESPDDGEGAVAADKESEDLADEEEVRAADDEDQEDDVEPDDAEDELTGDKEHYVPPPTEEEMTVNMEIDKELLSAATEDDEFSATLVGGKDPDAFFEENAEDVETIIMEGEFVHSAVEQERLAAESAARNQLDDPTKFADTYAVNRDKLRGGRRQFDPPGYAVIGAIVALTLALGVQVVHNSKENLATSGLFERTIAPVYRALGSPVIPAWDIKGWQFEATNGSVDEEETALVIVSRLTNRSQDALPYPLVHVSLTDRWEDIMGSRILQPGEYLAGGLDPSVPVASGENFTAVITIENPSAEATGFKLNVCYRDAPGAVRCAIEDFKN